MAAGKRGFSLVELLLVLAIVAVLLAGLIPILSSTREAAWGVSCLNNQRQMGVAWESVIFDNAGLIPNTFTSGSPQWDSLMLQVTGLTIQADGPVIACPVAIKEYGPLPPLATTYAVNMRWREDHAAGDNEGKPWGRLLSPSTYPLFADAGALTTSDPPVLRRYIGNPPSPEWRMGFIHPDNTSSVAYGDGHVEFESIDVLEGPVDNNGVPLWFFNRDPFGGIAALPRPAPAASLMTAPGWR